MFSLFSVLLFLSFWLMIIGLIRPNLIVRWGEKKTRKRVMLYYGLPFVIFFILFGITEPQNITTTVAPSVPIAVHHQESAQKQKVVSNSKKIVAKEAVQVFTKVDDEYQGVYTKFANIITGLSKNQIDEVTAYSDVQNLNSQILNVYGNAVGMNVPSEFSDDQESLEIAISDLRSSMSEFNDYLNTPHVKYMAEATNDLKQAQQGFRIQVLQVAKQAILDGYTGSKTASSQILTYAQMGLILKWANGVYENATAQFAGLQPGDPNTDWYNYSIPMLQTITKKEQHLPKMNGLPANKNLVNQYLIQGDVENAVEFVWQTISGMDI